MSRQSFPPARRARAYGFLEDVEDISDALVPVPRSFGASKILTALFRTVDDTEDVVRRTALFRTVEDTEDVVRREEEREEDGRPLLAAPAARRRRRRRTAFRRLSVLPSDVRSRADEEDLDPLRLVETPPLACNCSRSCCRKAGPAGVEASVVGDVFSVIHFSGGGNENRNLRFHTV